MNARAWVEVEGRIATLARIEPLHPSFDGFDIEAHAKALKRWDAEAHSAFPQRLSPFLSCSRAREFLPARSHWCVVSVTIQARFATPVYATCAC